MKKLLGILAFVGMSSSCIQLVVACEGKQQSKVIKQDLSTLRNHLGELNNNPNENDILNKFNDYNKIELKLNIDVTIEINNEDNSSIKAIITAKSESLKCTGMISVTLSKISLASYTITNLGSFESNPTDEKILEAFNNKNKIKDKILIDDITITCLNGTSAIINAKPGLTKYLASITVNFVIKTHLNTIINTDLGTFRAVPTISEIFNKFKSDNALITLELNTDIKIDEITETTAKISALNTSENWYGFIMVDFKSTMIKPTIYVDQNGIDQTSYALDLADLEITEIKQFGYYRSELNVVSLVGMPKTIQKVPTSLPKEITSLKEAFKNCKVFNQNIGSWNVSNVTDMSFIFESTDVFNQNIGSWNVSNVTDMSFMFGHALAFNQNISNWNVFNVTNMAYMFFGAIVFNQDISRWDVSKVINHNSFYIEDSIQKNYLPNWR